MAAQSPFFCVKRRSSFPSILLRRWEATCIADLLSHVREAVATTYIFNSCLKAQAAKPHATLWRTSSTAISQGHATFVSHRNVVFIVCPHVHVHRSSHGAPRCFSFITSSTIRSIQSVTVCMFIFFTKAGPKHQFKRKLLQFPWSWPCLSSVVPQRC